MARIDVPDGPGGDAEMIWKLRPHVAGMVERMISTVYGRSILPAEEREVGAVASRSSTTAACAVFRAVGRRRGSPAPSAGSRAAP